MEPWFDGQAYGWVPSVISAVAGASTGLLGEVLAPKGIGRRPLFTSLYIQIPASLLLIAASIYGRTTGQPQAVWSALLIPGIVGLVINTLTVFRLQRLFRKAASRTVAVQSGS